MKIFPSDYKKYIEGQDCLVGYDCSGDVVGHHEFAIGTSGNRKVSARNYTMVPLCGKHHNFRHSVGIAFWQQYKIDVWKEITRLIVLYITGYRLEMR